MALTADYIFAVQDTSETAPKKTTIAAALSLATAPSLDAVTTTGNTTDKTISLLDDNQ